MLQDEKHALRLIDRQRGPDFCIHASACCLLRERIFTGSLISCYLPLPLIVLFISILFSVVTGGDFRSVSLGDKGRIMGFLGEGTICETLLFASVFCVFICICISLAVLYYSREHYTGKGSCKVFCISYPYTMLGMSRYVSENSLARLASVIGVQEEDLKDTDIGLVVGKKRREKSKMRMPGLSRLPSTASY